MALMPTSPVLAPIAGRAGARHVRRIPERPGRPVPWPAWVPEALRMRLAERGIDAPWTHQAAAAELARAGQPVIVATGTASGKTLALWLPVLEAVMGDDTATALYLSPTKALAHDQLRSLEALAVPGLRVAAYDGDTPPDERRWVRAHAHYVFSNPDLVHRSMLPRHTAWSRFLRGLRYIVLDEAHHYRGMFGSHVALVVRRLLRVARQYGSDPIVLCASATVADPARTATRLVGRPVEAITDDGAPRGAMTAVLWEPPEVLGAVVADKGERKPRRSAIAETADLLADLVCSEVRTLAFVHSRRGAETVAMLARDEVSEVDESLVDRVASYRGGYLPEERRALERDLRDGHLLGVATTNALELGIDISGLDAVVISGWPGTRASLWQQWGRAGRRQGDALGVLVAREDPLDRYVLEHPGVIFDQPVEAVVLDPTNPHVLGPHLLAAAAEQPLTEQDATTFFGPTAIALLDDLTAQGLLRRRRTGWFWTSPDSPADRIDLRGTAGRPVQLVEEGTGRLLGTVEAARAPASVHAGAVYVHQGITHVVEHLDLDDAVAIVRPEQVDYSTTATEVADYRIISTDEEVAWGDARLCRGEVEVTSRVVGYLKRRYATAEILGEEPLDMPERVLRTRGVWWTLSDAQVRAATAHEVDIAGAAHAAEHASIGLLPLVATCDRWDIGGVSTALHPDTMRCTVMVYDGHPGGAGFVDRAYDEAEVWLSATRAAIAGCPCEFGCPSCVQSPKCGNGNEPLDKAGAVRLLDLLLGGSSAS